MCWHGAQRPMLVQHGCEAWFAYVSVEKGRGKGSGSGKTSSMDGQWQLFVLGKKISTWKPNEVFCINVFRSNCLGNLTWKTPIGTAPLAFQIAEVRINFCSKYPA